MQVKKFQTWMKLATTTEKKQLAKLCDTNLTYLYVIASGARKSSSAFAAKIEHHSQKLRLLNPKLPVLLRGDLCPSCAVCPHYCGGVK